MEFDFSIFEKQDMYNDILREKYNRLQKEERALVGGSGRRITQGKIGKSIGLSDSFISRWLNKERELGVEMVIRMSETLLIEEGLLNLRKENASK